MIVRIKDFNCIKNIELEFKPGFTILQGSSNSGKSSVFKAIENCIFNQSGTVNVRQGCNNYSVGISKDDHTVSLIKGKDTKYKVDDIIYEKIGVNQLSEVAESLNIRETILGGEKVRLNFSKQMSYPFLLDKTPGQLYKFIVDSSESESLSNVLKDMAKDIKELDRSLTQNEAQMDLLIKQQSQINDNLKDSDLILEASNKIIDLDSEYQRVEQLEKCSQQYTSISLNKSQLLERMSHLNININIFDLDSLYAGYLQYNEIYSKYYSCMNERNNLENKLKSLNVNIDLNHLNDLMSSYNTILEVYKSHKDLNNYINVTKSNIEDCNSRIEVAKNKLSEFKVCPLCGKEITDN